jgi:hypothetical protein
MQKMTGIYKIGKMILRDQENEVRRGFSNPESEYAYRKGRIYSNNQC